MPDRFARLGLFAFFLVIAFGGAGCTRQAKIERRLAAADSSFSSGQYDRAEIEYLNVLQLDPASGRAIARLGEIYFDQGRIGSTYLYLARARELRPDDLELRTKFGLYLLAAGKWDAARAEARFILDRKPDDAEALLLLANSSVSPANVADARATLARPAGAPSAAAATATGILDVRDHNLPAARTAFARALALDHDYAPALTAVATIALADGDPAAAEKAFAAAAEHSPPRSPRRLQFAEFEFERGQPEEARRQLKAMIDQTPDYLPALMLLAEHAAQDHQWAESGALVDRVLAKSPVHLEALLLQARLAVESGDAAKSIPKLEGALKIYPQSAPLRYHLALCYAATGDTARAARFVNDALGFAPDYTDAVLLNASLSIRRGEAKAAVIALRQFVQKHPTASLRAWILLAEAFHASGDFDEALAVYRHAAEIAPQDPQIAWLAGLIHLQQGQRTAARSDFEHALALAPEYLPAVEQLVGLDLGDRRPDDALALVDRHVAVSPQVAGLHLLRAQVLVAQGNTAAAETSLRRALELDSKSTAAFYALARLYVSTHQQDKALASLKKSAAGNPRDVPTLMLMGAIEEERKNFPAAREAYEKIIVLDPRYAPALNNLAYLYSEQLHDNARALRMAQRAREVLPNDAHVADTLGWILYQGGQFTWALALLEESAAKLPDSPAIQFHVAMTHLALGDETAGRQAFQRALHAANDFDGRTEAEEALALLAIDPAHFRPADQAVIDRALARRPDNPIALLRLAAVEENTGAIDRARTTYENILHGSPRSFSALAGLARLDATNGQTAKAFDLAKIAHEVKPDDPAITHLLGRLALDAGNADWAATLLEDGAQASPDDGDLLFDLAQARFATGNVPAAAETMSRALAKSPLMPRASAARQFLALAAIAAHPEAGPQAAETVSAALQADANDTAALYAQAILAEHGADSAAAIHDFEAVLSRLPSFTPAMRELAILYSPSESRKAADLAVKARVRYPSDSLLGKALGIALYHEGDMTGAEHVLEESAARMPDDGDLWAYLGLARIKLGQLPGGRSALQKSVGLHPAPELREEAEHALSNSQTGNR
ncbi:MAG TPA: tetratricopeptide repeat protein [Candidatus Didemnitutus sp.]|jgi:tetratricopeptide (TPR) repeat protein